MTQHTPGPWKVSANLARGRYCVDGPGNIGIAVTHGGVDLGPESDVAKANARLIAAAPELLAALKELMQRTKYLWEQGGTPAESAMRKRARSKARTAIARAEREDR